MIIAPSCGAYGYQHPPVTVGCIWLKNFDYKIFKKWRHGLCNFSYFPLWWWWMNSHSNYNNYCNYTDSIYFAILYTILNRVQSKLFAHLTAHAQSECSSSLLTGLCFCEEQDYKIQHQLFCIVTGHIFPHINWSRNIWNNCKKKMPLCC